MAGSQRRRGLVALTGLVAATLTTVLAGPAALADTGSAVSSPGAWTHQLGTAGDDIATGSATAPDGTTYVVGRTEGTLPGSSDANAGGDDAFVAAYRTDGTRAWVRQLGTTADDGATAVALDPDGTVVVAGSTDGILPGSGAAGTLGTTGFLASYTPAGVRRWTRQIGLRETTTRFVVVDATHTIHLAGSAPSIPGVQGTGLGFIATYTAAGTRRAVARIPSDITSLAVDGTGKAYVVGTVNTAGALGSMVTLSHTYEVDTDATVVERIADNCPGTDAVPECSEWDTLAVVVDDAGEGWWVRSEISYDVTADDFVRQLVGRAITVTDRPDVVLGEIRDPLGRDALHLTMDAAHDVYAATTLSTDPAWLGDGLPYGGTDGLLGVFDSRGVLPPQSHTSFRRVGTPADDTLVGLAVDGAGEVHGAGTTRGTLPDSAEANAGGADVVITHFDRSLATQPTVDRVTPGASALVVDWSSNWRGPTELLRTGTVACTSSDGGAPGSTVVNIWGSMQPVSVTGLTDGSTYRCTVAVTTATGGPVTSAPSAPQVVGTPSSAFVTATAGSDQVSIDWTAAPSNGAAVVGYRVTCRDASDTIAATTEALAPPVVFTGLAPGRYSCGVAARNSRGVGPAGLARPSIVGGQRPGAPTIGAATQANGVVEVAFTPGAAHGLPATHRATCRDAAGTVSGTSRPATAGPLLVAGLRGGISYTCTVASTNDVGTSDPSSPSNAVVPIGQPRLEGMNLDRGDTIVDVTITPKSDEGSPILRFDVACTGLSPGTGSRVTGRSTTPVVRVIGLHRGEPYACVGTATNAIGTSVGVRAPYVVLDGLPPAPGKPTAVAGTGRVSLTWAPPHLGPGSPRVTWYIVRMVYGPGDVELREFANARTTQTLTGLRRDWVGFTVAAVNARGTGPQSLMTAADLLTPDPPTRVAAVGDATSAVVSWHRPVTYDPRSVDAFVIIARPDHGAAIRVTAPGGVTSRTITGLTAGRRYSFTVTTRDAVHGLSAPSTPTPAITIGPPLAPRTPAAPTAVAAGAGAATLTWVAPDAGSATITGFVITPYIGSTAQAPRTVGNVRTTTITGLTPGRTYRFTVTALSPAGASPRSPSSAAITISH